MSASTISRNRFVSGGHLRRLLFCLNFALILCSFQLFFFFSVAQAQVSSNPGNQLIAGVESPVSADSFDQYSPALAGNFALWAEYDTSTIAGRTRIFYKDLSAQGEPKHALFDNENGGGNPVYSEAAHRVVWSEWMGSYCQLYYLDNTDLSTYGGCSGTVDQCGTPSSVILDQPGNMSFSPDGSKAVWKEGEIYSQVRYYDFNTHTVQAVNGISNHTQEKPSMDNNWIVWTERWNYNSMSQALNWEICAKNIATGELVPVDSADASATPGDLVRSPSIGHNANGEPVVVYVSGNSELLTQRYDLESYNLSTGERRHLASASTNGSLDNPNVNENKVVWQDCGITGCQIKFLDLSANVIQIISQSPGDNFPIVSANSEFVVWVNRQQHPYQIYYNRADTFQGLANKYRPELRLTSGENFEPMPVEQFLSAPGTTLRQVWHPDFSILKPTASTLAQYADTANLYIDLQGDSIVAGGGNPSRAIDHGYVFNHYSKPYQTGRDNPGSQFPRTIYARVVSNPNGDGISFIQYWLCYYANDHAEVFHEGDWEVVQVDIDRNLKPYRADYSQHGYGQWRNWNGPGGVEKSGAFPDRPVVYVGLGSHANYFTASAQQPIYYKGADLSKIKVWDDASGSGNRLNTPDVPGSMPSPIFTQIKVVPETDQVVPGSEFDWLKYKGQWGEWTDADLGWEGCLFCLPPVPAVRISGERNGSDNPPLQTYWTNAFAWNNNNCDGCQDEQAQGTETEATAKSPVDISFYDSQGRHTGKNPDGSIDQQIPNSEYLEYPDLHRKSIIIHGSDISGGYRFEATGNGSGPADLIVTAPDHPGGTVDTLNYNAIQVNPATRISLNLDAAKNYSAAIDAYGDGTNIIQKDPDTTITNSVDFTPPAQVSNLAVTSTTSGSASVAFTAPGDDGNTGTATAYDLRYSTSTITDQDWQDAVPASGMPAPLSAGSTQTITVNGLNPGTTYYFALKATDKVALQSPLSNVATVTTTIPNLTWGINRIYWASWADYVNRQLSIDYNLRNIGTGIATGVTVAASYGNPTSVYVTTPLPLTVGGITPNSFSTVTIKYYVPTSVGSFTTTTYANCQDDAGRTYWFPGPMP